MGPFVRCALHSFFIVGDTDGDAEGLPEGDHDGDSEGLTDGDMLGMLLQQGKNVSPSACGQHSPLESSHAVWKMQCASDDGEYEGDADGLPLGEAVGDLDGDVLGLSPVVHTHAAETFRKNENHG